MPVSRWDLRTPRMTGHLQKSVSLNKMMLCRVLSMILYPTEIPVFPRLHPQNLRSFPTWKWHPYHPHPLLVVRKYQTFLVRRDALTLPT